MIHVHSLYQTVSQRAFHPGQPDETQLRLIRFWDQHGNIRHMIQFYDEIHTFWVPLFRTGNLLAFGMEGVARSVYDDLFARSALPDAPVPMLYRAQEAHFQLIPSAEQAERYRIALVFKATAMVRAIAIEWGLPFEASDIPSQLAQAIELNIVHQCGTQEDRLSQARQMTTILKAIKEQTPPAFYLEIIDLPQAA